MIITALQHKNEKARYMRGREKDCQSLREHNHVERKSTSRKNDNKAYKNKDAHDMRLYLD